MWPKPNSRSNSKSAALIPPLVLALNVPPLPNPLQVVHYIPLLLFLPPLFLNLGILTFCFRPFCLGQWAWGRQAVLYIVECLALSLDSMHWLSEEPGRHPPPPVGFDNHRCL